MCRHQLLNGHLNQLDRQGAVVVWKQPARCFRDRPHQRRSPAPPRRSCLLLNQPARFQSAQVLTDGQVRFDSIYRFKGQQAPAVIVVDVPRASERSTGDWARFYVAITRATVRLDLVGPFS